MTNQKYKNILISTHNSQLPPLILPRPACHLDKTRLRVGSEERQLTQHLRYELRVADSFARLHDAHNRRLDRDTVMRYTPHGPSTLRRRKAETIVGWDGKGLRQQKTN